MSGRWYYRQDGVEAGPVSLPQVKQLVHGGALAPTDWVRDGETNPWKPVSKTPEVSAPRATFAPPPPQRAPVAAAPVRAAAAAAAPAPVRAAPAPQRAAPPPAPKPLPVGAAVAPAATVTPIALPNIGAHETKRSAHRAPVKSSPVVFVGLALGAVVVVSLGVMVAVMQMNAEPEGPVVIVKPHPTDLAMKAKKEAEAAALEGPGLLRAQTTTAQSMGKDKWIPLPVKKAGWKGLLGLNFQSVTWSGPQLRVDVQVTNVSPNPLPYESWNKTAASNAWLMDGQLAHVAQASGSDSSRELAPDESITETLVFDCGQSDFDELRLVLPAKAVKMGGQLGFLISGPILRGEKELGSPGTIAAATPKTPRIDDGGDILVPEKTPKTTPKIPPGTGTGGSSGDGDVIVLDAPKIPGTKKKNPLIDNGERLEDLDSIAKEFNEKEDMKNKKKNVLEED